MTSLNTFYSLKYPKDLASGKDIRPRTIKYGATKFCIMGKDFSRVEMKWSRTLDASSTKELAFGEVETCGGMD